MQGPPPNLNRSDYSFGLPNRTEKQTACKYQASTHRWDCHRTAAPTTPFQQPQLIGSPMAVPLVVSGVYLDVIMFWDVLGISQKPCNSG